MKKITLDNAQQQLSNLVKNVKDTSTEYVITINRVPSAVLMSADKYESERETDLILRDKGLMRAIRQGEKELAEGKGIPWEKVKKELGLK